MLLLLQWFFASSNFGLDKIITTHTSRESSRGSEVRKEMLISFYKRGNPLGFPLSEINARFDASSEMIPIPGNWLMVNGHVDE